MSKKTQRESRHIFSMMEKFDAVSEELWELSMKERPWLDPAWHLGPENANKEMVILEFPEERRQLEIKKATIYNEVMQLMEDYGWSKV